MSGTVMKASGGLGERNPLALALLLSLLLHLLLFGTWRLGEQLGWWRQNPAWLQRLNPAKWLPKPVLQPVKTTPKRTKEIPLNFLEVDPATAVAEPPPAAKFYGAQNARAANPDATVETPIPKVDGKQAQVARVETVAKPNPVPLQPTAPPVTTKPAEEAPAPPKKAEAPGDLAKAKPAERPPEVGSAETAAIPRDRPRTLAAARARKATQAGEKMKQEGGVSQRGRMSFDVKATPFGAYDEALIAAVQQRWYDLLENTPYVQRSGKVVIQFRLNYDGRVTDIRVAGNEVGELLALLCQRAILDPAPFARWPTDMRRAIGGNYRDVSFTFYYN